MTFDVVVVGEVLVELASDRALGDGVPLTLGISGDVVNAAAAAAAAGARTAVLARIADDELGDVIEARLAELGIDTSLVRRVRGQQGAYVVHADPHGQREFVYLRRGSAGSTLAPEDVVAAGLESAGAVLTTGVTAALSTSARAAVYEVAQRASCLVYDPNFRPRLTTAAEAAGVLRALAPRARVVTPAAPGESSALLGTDDPGLAARIVLGLGAEAAVVTRGGDGVLVVDAAGPREVPAVPAPRLVDQTGAGDSLAGTLTARLVLGDSLDEAVRLGTAAASLVLGGRGGTGLVPTLAQMRSHLGVTA
ncbi:2-dehydro-3-deoxygluconokinase [Nocardioides terrae]|uniref:2-dehydro-3-deoxygluconokinase n=1 Tax=Nocardioides terrae TaxID=574651 RepID=A0A1I1L2H2_9ACTN|nr:sugar kinase [Nocardioides terrae]SFC67125.1 2-dehydro-3-deoxygluconokinase [Nocardioides terrae]